MNCCWTEGETFSAAEECRTTIATCCRFRRACEWVNVEHKFDYCRSSIDAVPVAVASVSLAAVVATTDLRIGVVAIAIVACSGIYFDQPNQESNAFCSLDETFCILSHAPYPADLSFFSTRPIDLEEATPNSPWLSWQTFSNEWWPTFGEDRDGSTRIRCLWCPLCMRTK